MKKRMYGFRDLCLIARLDYPAISEGLIRQLLNRKVIPSVKKDGRVWIDDKGVQAFRDYCETRSRAMQCYRLALTLQPSTPDIQCSVERPWEPSFELLGLPAALLSQAIKSQGLDVVPPIVGKPERAEWQRAKKIFEAAKERNALALRVQNVSVKAGRKSKKGTK